VLAGGDQQLASMVSADRQQPQQPGSGPTDEGGQPLVSQVELGFEQLNAVGDCLQRCLAGLQWVGQTSLVGSEPGAGGDQRRRGAVGERLADRGWGGDQ
jgi:hypothetical protein